jgi:hypothetical protein
VELGQAPGRRAAAAVRPHSKSGVAVGKAAQAALPGKRDRLPQALVTGVARPTREALRTRRAAQTRAPCGMRFALVWFWAALHRASRSTLQPLDPRHAARASPKRGRGAGEQRGCAQNAERLGPAGAATRCLALPGGRGALVAGRAPGCGPQRALWGRAGREGSAVGAAGPITGCLLRRGRGCLLRATGATLAGPWVRTALYRRTRKRPRVDGLACAAHGSRSKLGGECPGLGQLGGGKGRAREHNSP